MTLDEVIRAWENVTWESTILIEFYNKYYTHIGDLKISVNEINKPTNTYHDLLKKQVFQFRKSVNGIRFRCLD